MPHVVILIHLLSFGVGLAAVVELALAAATRKSTIAGRTAEWWTSFLVILLLVIVNQYLQVNVHRVGLPVITFLFVLTNGATIVSLILMGRLTALLLRRPINAAESGGLFVLTTGYIVMVGGIVLSYRPLPAKIDLFELSATPFHIVFLISMSSLVFASQNTVFAGNRNWAPVRRTAWTGWYVATLLFFVVDYLVAAAGFPFSLNSFSIAYGAWSIVLLVFTVRFNRSSGDGPGSIERFVARYGITPREQEVTDLLLHGNTMETIASVLGIAYKTVDTHVANIYRKTGVHSRVELARCVFEPDASRDVS